LHLEVDPCFRGLLLPCRPAFTEWRDVDWLDSKLNVEQSIVRQIVDDVKTDSSRKSLSIDKELLEILKLWKQKTLFGSLDDWVFASPFKLGRLPYSYTGFWRELGRAGKAAGIGRLGTHAFRHYAGYRNMPNAPAIWARYAYLQVPDSA
jgi:integrase